MKALAGAVVVLAGAILIAAGQLAEALVRSAGRTGDPGVFATLTGVLVGLIGLGILAFGGPAQPEPPPVSPRGATPPPT